MRMNEILGTSPNKKDQQHFLFPVSISNLFSGLAHFLHKPCSLQSEIEEFFSTECDKKCKEFIVR